MFRVNLFKAKLVACGKSAKDVAVILGINEATLYRKMNGKSDFTRNEIQIVRQALAMTTDEVENIFFAG